MPRSAADRQPATGAVKRRPRTIKRPTPAEASQMIWGDMFAAEAASGLKHSTIYELANEEHIGTTKVGGRRLFHIPSLLAYLESRATGLRAAP